MISEPVADADADCVKLRLEPPDMNIVVKDLVQAVFEVVELGIAVF